MTRDLHDLLKAMTALERIIQEINKILTNITLKEANKFMFERNRRRHGRNNPTT